MVPSGECEAARSREKVSKTGWLIFESSGQPEASGCELRAASDSEVTVTLLRSSASKIRATGKICMKLGNGLVLWGQVTLNVIGPMVEAFD